MGSETTIKSTVVLIHGWRVRDHGVGTVGRLAPFFREQGYVVKMPSYGYTLTKRSTGRKSRDLAKVISQDLQPGSLVVAHSNGAYVARELSHYMPKRSTTFVLIQPALDPHLRPLKGCRRQLVSHSRRDVPIFLSQFVPWSDWGKMGRVGFQPDPLGGIREETRVHNLEWDGGHSTFSDDPEPWAHLSMTFHLYSHGLGSDEELFRSAEVIGRLRCA